MAARRLPMKKIKYILSLHHDQGYSVRWIARQTGVGRSTVSRTLARLKTSKLTWAQCKALSNDELMKVLYPSGNAAVPTQRPLPDWGAIQKALAKHSYVTLRVLWMEYKAAHPEGLEYSQYCKLYRDWRRGRERTDARLHKRAGYTLEMDYSGKRMFLTCERTGKTTPVELFVAVLGVSQFIYAEVTMTQQLKDVCSSVRRCFEALGGVPRVLVSDNMKTVVVSPSKEDVPKINEQFQQLADHYGVCLIPTRPGHPKDKASVEKGVQVVQSYILARLRNRCFYSLQDLNAAIEPLLTELNARPFQKKEGSRLSWFEELDKPALRPLPPTPFRYAEWTSKRKVQFNYHIAIHNCYYSVPFKYIGQTVYARMDEDTVEIYLDKQDEMSIAAHRRGKLRGQYVTTLHHMPSHHRAMATWSPERFLAWASEFGPNTRALIGANFYRFEVPEQAFRRCRSLLGLGKKYGAELLEAAAKEALDRQALSYPAVKQIMEERLSARDRLHQRTGIHDHVRGPDYYRDSQLNG